MFLTKAFERSEDLYEFLLELIQFLYTVEDFYNELYIFLYHSNQQLIFLFCLTLLVTDYYNKMEDPCFYCAI